MKLKIFIDNYRFRETIFRLLTVNSYHPDRVARRKSYYNELTIYKR